MDAIINALLSCLALAILSGAILALSWESRDRLELIQLNSTGLIVKFGKNGKSRK